MSYEIQESQTGLHAGDRIRLEGQWGAYYISEVELFRDCLGVFLSTAHREAGQFTPLCELYGPGAGSEDRYISNFGTYTMNPVAQWAQVPKDTPLEE